MIRALLVGINHYAKQSGLDGCLNDVDDVRGYLMDHGVDPMNILCLKDSEATKAGIVGKLNDLLTEAEPGDHLYFHFAGHGVRMPGADPEEPDMADEALCPYEFDWTGATAIIDDEILKILDTMQGGVRLTFVVDSCHSGDFTRVVLPPGTIARTLAPPASIRARLGRRGTVRGFRSAGRDNCAFVSACLPWQAAADASFDGRPNGAFTYNFLKLAKGAPGDSLDDLVIRLEPVLKAYEMTPISEGSTEIRAEPYAPLQSRGLVRRPTVHVLSPRGEVTVFEETWQTNVFGKSASVSCRIAASNGELTGYITANFFTEMSWSVPLNGDTAIQVDLGFGVRLGVSVSGWSFDADSIRFDLGIDVAPPFLPPIRVARIPISIPTSVFTREVLAAAQSPADLMALLALRRAQSGQVEEGYRIGAAAPAPRGIGAPLPPGLERLPTRDVVRSAIVANRALRGDRETFQPSELDRGMIQYGWGTKLNTVIEPAEFGIKKGFIRHGEPDVRLDPGSDGWCAFQGWLSEEDRSDLRFYLHIGSTWSGTCRWIVYGHRADIVL